MGLDEQISSCGRLWPGVRTTAHTGGRPVSGTARSAFSLDFNTLASEALR